MCFCFTSNENCHFSSEKRLHPKTGLLIFLGKEKHIPKQNHGTCRGFLTKKVTTTTVNPGNRRGFCVCIHISPFFLSFFMIFLYFFVFFFIFIFAFFLHFSFFLHFFIFSFFIFLYFLSCSSIFFHFLTFSFIFLHFPSFSFIFFHFSIFSIFSFSFIFVHFLSFSFIFFHFLSCSFSLLGAQNLIFFGPQFRYDFS